MASSANDLYNYINNNFGKVTILDNGFYYAKDSHGNELYVNPNDKNVNLVTLYPGSGGSTNDARAVRSLMSSSNPPNYSCIISKSSTDPNRVLDTATDILNSNGYTISSLATTGFSRSGGMVIQRTAEYLRKHPELASSTSIIVNDGYNITTECGSDLQILIDNGVPIVMIAPTEKVSSRTFDAGRKLGNQGLNVSIMTTNDNSHMYIHDYCYYNGVPEYVLCLRDSIGTDGKVRKPEYVLLKYNPDTKKFEETKDYSGIQIQSLIDLDSFDYSFVRNYGKTSDTFKSTYAKDTKVSEKYADLKEITDLHFTLGINNSFDDGMKSNMLYIENSINQIRQQVKQSGFLQGVSHGTFRSSTGIPGCLNGYIDAYYDIMGQLMDLIVEQTEAIMSYGQAYIDMDADLQRRAEELSAGTFTGGIVEEPPRVKVREPLKGEEDNLEITETPAPGDTGKTQGGGSRGGSTGGGSPGTGVPVTPTPTPTDPTDPTEPETPEEGANLIEFERKDGSKVIAVMDGETIKELKYVYEYETVEEAEKHLEQIKEKHKDIEYIEEVKLNENKVEAIFKEEAYKDMPLDKVIEKYFVDLEEEKEKIENE